MERAKMNFKRGCSGAAMLMLAVSLAGCSTFGSDQRITTSQAPEQLAPVQDSSVNSSSLPPLGGAQGGNSLQVSGGAGVGGAVGQDPALANNAPPPAQTANANGSFVTLNDARPGSTPAGTGRDLSGGLTIEKLIGGWTVVSGAAQCKLNLTYTTKTGTSRYRASTPGCPIAGLAPVASWQLVGSQVQLFNEGGKLIGTLLLSGGRFIGTLAGGQGISMSS
jgi:hypothetical protein